MSKLSCEHEKKTKPISFITKFLFPIATAHGHNRFLAKFKPISITSKEPYSIESLIGNESCVCSCFPVKALCTNKEITNADAYFTIPEFSVFQIKNNYVSWGQRLVADPVEGTVVICYEGRYYCIPRDFVGKCCVPLRYNNFEILYGDDKVIWPILGAHGDRPSGGRIPLYGLHEECTFFKITMPLIMIFRYSLPEASKPFATGIIDTIQKYLDAEKDAKYSHEKDAMEEKVCKLISGIYKTISEMGGITEPQIDDVCRLQLLQDEKCQKELWDREEEERQRKERVEEFIKQIDSRNELLNVFNSKSC